MIQATDGLLLVTGPTGSGKSSTLHATLSRLVHAGRKVVSLEDPVEHEQAGVVQVGIRPDLGLGFPEAVRAVLRQSPEVIAVGEIRDGETARSCLNAALTGHLVLSTLHTGDAVGAIVRLRDLGMSPPLLASALRGIVAQRLVRRCCLTCSGNPHSASDGGRACGACSGGGFLGRVALTELLVVDETMRQLIRAGASADTLRLAAKAAGFRGLADHGRDRVRAGITNAAEVARVLGEELT
jgi:type II secretory ATPase GspE/PulE/Tfp pilus assembly ATPase PilB-like protein